MQVDVNTEPGRQVPLKGRVEGRARWGLGRRRGCGHRVWLPHCELKSQRACTDSAKTQDPPVAALLPWNVSADFS